MAVLTTQTRNSLRDAVFGLPKARHTTVFSEKQRTQLASKGVAMRDGSFPIRNKQDLANAEQAIGRANPSKRPAVKAHIRARARALGK